MAHSSSTTAFLTVEKSFTYRGGREHWSNAYHFDNVPADKAQWDAVWTAVWNLEKACFSADVQFEQAFGHNPGTPPVLVWENEFSPPGEGGPPAEFVPGSTAHPAPGDAAVFVRYSTTQKSSLGKPIYLWNYYHGVYFDGATPDIPDPAQRQHLDSLGTVLVTGLNTGISGAPIFKRAGPKGAVAQAHVVGEFITTRTLKHRGKRHRFGTPTAQETRLQSLVEGLLDLNNALKPPAP